MNESLTAEIEIQVNGAPRAVPPGLTLRGLLAHLGLEPGTVVVERNREIVRRPALDATAVRPGDRIEIVHFVGGG